MFSAQSSSSGSDDDYWDDRFGTLGLNGPVAQMATYGDKVYVIGDFTQAGGVPATNFAKWDGNAWSALPELPSGRVGVRAMAANNQGLFIGGRIVSPTATNTILRLGDSGGCRMINWLFPGRRPIPTLP